VINFCPWPPRLDFWHARGAIKSAPESFSPPETFSHRRSKFSVGVKGRPQIRKRRRRGIFVETVVKNLKPRRGGIFPSSADDTAPDGAWLILKLPTTKMSALTGL
jgi:hypothetical protein